MTPDGLLRMPLIAWSHQQNVVSAWLHYSCMLHLCLHAPPWCMQIYPITMASWVFGRKPPSAVNALAVLHKSGVDVTSVVNLK